MYHGILYPLAVNLGYAMHLVGAEEEDIPRAYAVFHAPHRVHSASAFEDRYLEVGVVMPSRGAPEGGDKGSAVGERYSAVLKPYEILSLFIGRAVHGIILPSHSTKYILQSYKYI